jgi:succinyl-CoA synthetase beta subunit
MLLTEAEGKEILAAGGLTTLPSVLLDKNEFEKSINPVDIFSKLKFPTFVKAQVLYGNRALQGLVKEAKTPEDAIKIAADFFSQTDQNNQPITQILVEQAISFDQPYYLSISYDTRSRTPVIRFSKEGGAGMDDRGDSIESLEISISDNLESFPPHPEAYDFVSHLYQIFLKNDAVLMEINPLVFSQGHWYCLDAKIELEDTAAYRHPEWEHYSKRSGLGRPPTKVEEAAHQVSRSDHRGVAGESFFEFEGGHIGVMASGGGASVLAMDAMMAEGLKPANYTEYSGNPTREKVAKLADVVLSIPNLTALYVAGSNANFTDIYETLAGVVDGILRSPYADQQDFAVLIRRGGPRWEEGFAMVKERLAEKPLNLKLFGPESSIVATASELKKMLTK